VQTCALPIYVHDAGQYRFGRRQIGHRDGDRAEAADLVLGGHGAAVPGMRFAGAAVVEQPETLAFGILEIETRSPVLLCDLACYQVRIPQPCRPPVEACRPCDPQASAADRMRPTPLGPGGPVEEREIGARSRQPVGIEEMIGAGIVLV